MDRAFWQMRNPGFRNPKSDLPLEKNCIAALRIGFKNHPAQLPSSDKMHIFVNECNLGDYIGRQRDREENLTTRYVRCPVQRASAL